MPGLHCSFSFFKQVTYFQLHLYSHLQRFLVLPVPKIWENLRHTLVCSLLAPPHSTWVSARAALEISCYSSILFSPSRMLLSSLSCCCLLCSYWLHDFMSFFLFFHRHCSNVWGRNSNKCMYSVSQDSLQVCNRSCNCYPLNHCTVV